MSKIITDYTSRRRKLEVQKKIYSKITKKTFVGLCGPNVLEYLDKINYKRFTRVTLYETDKNIFTNIVRILGNKYPTVRVYNDSINKHLGKTKAFYDLDYCRCFESIRRYMPLIAKIEEFSMTVSTRFYGYPFESVAQYLGHSNYIHYSYRDGTPMVSIFVSKNIKK